MNRQQRLSRPGEPHRMDGYRAVTAPAPHEGIASALRDAFGTAPPAIPADLERLLLQLH